MRTEQDSLGNIEIEDHFYYGLATARSLKFFGSGPDQLPFSFIKNYAQLKKACAIINEKLSCLDRKRKDLIVQACDEIITGKHRDQFPVSVWQTGSGTQTNMNLNEVIANRANELAGQPKGSNTPVHPNNHVNQSQSSNDTFPTVMHITAVLEIEENLLPAIQHLIGSLKEKSKKFQGIIKIGRTHLQDATPITLEQEFSGYIHLLEQDVKQIKFQSSELLNLAIGGTAVGTGVNSPNNFSPLVCDQLSTQLDYPFRSHPNKFSALSGHNECVGASSALKRLACSLMKIANDIRWLASGPRCGLGELNLPANEAGSSIMPGKVNPTQSEALAMVSVQVISNDAAIAFSATQGNFELNVYKPIMIYNLLHSIELLTHSTRRFSDYCINGLSANEEKIAQYLHNSLMLVTALSPVIGYDKAAQIAKLAHEENSTLKKACLKLGFLSEEEFNRAIQPEKMISPQ